MTKNSTPVRVHFTPVRVHFTPIFVHFTPIFVHFLWFVVRQALDDDKRDRRGRTEVSVLYSSISKNLPTTGRSVYSDTKLVSVIIRKLYSGYTIFEPEL